MNDDYNKFQNIFPTTLICLQPGLLDLQKIQWKKSGELDALKIELDEEEIESAERW